MRIHHFQHVPFEGLAGMEPYLREQGHHLGATRCYRGEAPPALARFDCLIVMGGPMGVYDEREHPWLIQEKDLIRLAIANGKIVLGVCLGAQLIADAMGAFISRNAHKEIGWYPLVPDAAAATTIMDGLLPPELEVFHWHGDTFEIPSGAIRLASSQACRNQGFIFENRVVALQFHLETTPESAHLLLDNCADELDRSRYVQDAEEMFADPGRFERINAVMRELLRRLGL